MQSAISKDQSWKFPYLFNRIGFPNSITKRRVLDWTLMIKDTRIIMTCLDCITTRIWISQPHLIPCSQIRSKGNPLWCTNTRSIVPNIDLFIEEIKETHTLWGIIYIYVRNQQRGYSPKCARPVFSFGDVQLPIS